MQVRKPIQNQIVLTMWGGTTFNLQSQQLKTIQSFTIHFVPMNRQEFITTYSSPAINGSRFTGIFPSIVMAQAIYESGNGNSDLAQNAKNFFAIAADPSWKGKSYNGWRQYDNWKQSFIDHITFLQKNSRYAENGVFTAQTPEEQAIALQQAHYSTGSDYADRLIQIINQNNLKQLDTKQTRQNIVYGCVSGIGLLTITYFTLNAFGAMPKALQIKKLQLKH